MYDVCGSGGRALRGGVAEGAERRFKMSGGTSSFQNVGLEIPQTTNNDS